MAEIEFVTDNVKIEADGEKSILDHAIKQGIPMLHSCGGNARCSTCRVIVSKGLDNCSPRSTNEQKMADLLGFNCDIRLGCQTKVTGGHVEVRRLVLDDKDRLLIGDVRSKRLGAVGDEKKVAILFADIRGFTTFSENLPPYDVVHVLNRYFNDVGEAIKKHGGTINNYMGDGLMALFGLEYSEGAVLNAIRASFDMTHEVERLKPYLKSIYGKSFNIGIGIHYGDVVIGEIGERESARLTAIGDAVNVTSRIEAMTKSAGVNTLISESAYIEVEGKIDAYPKCSDTTLVGKSGSFTLYEVQSLKED